MIRVKPGAMLYFKYLYPYLALGVYPLAKWIPGIITQKFAQSVGVSELVILAAAFIIPFIKFKRFRLYIDGGGLHLREGIFVVRKINIESPRSTVISIDRGPISRMLSSAHIEVYTSAGVRNSPLIKTYISRQSADTLQREYLAEDTAAVKRFKLREIFIYTLGSSSFIAGIFVAVPTLNRILTLGGKSLAEILIGVFGGGTAELDVLISRIFKIPILLLAAGYVLDFFKRFIDMWSFKLTDNEHHLTLRRGLLRLHTVVIPKDSICAVVCRQNPFFALFKKKSASLLSNGYGRRIKDNDCILPLINESDRPGDAGGVKGIIKCKKAARLRPCKPYIWIAVSVALSAVGLEFLLPEAQIISVIASAVFLYCIAAISIRYESYKKCFLIFGDMVSVRGQYHLSTREMHIPREHVAAVKISQNPFDKKYSVCKVRVYAAHKSQVSTKLKNLPTHKTVSAVYKKFVE